MPRKLERSVSTFGEDMDISLGEALTELDRLNNQRRLLRERWERRNVMTSSCGGNSKMRPMIGHSSSVSSSSSLSSSSSSSSSSGSMSSFSFSSSRSATLSSTESWDSFSDDPLMVTDLGPRVARRSSKPKVNLYRPYCKPRRFSLQLVSHPESPELDDLTHRNVDPKCSGRLTPPRYSRLSEKENMKVKSNPTSPSKTTDVCQQMVCAIDTNYLVCATHVHDKHQSLSSSPYSSSGVLIRSKSLDDLTCIGSTDAVVSSYLFPKSSTAAVSCDIDNVLQRISTLQV